MLKQANYIKPIHNNIEYSKALKDIESLWDKAIPETPEGDKFELLCLVIDSIKESLSAKTGINFKESFDE